MACIKQKKASGSRYMKKKTWKIENSLTICDVFSPICSYYIMIKFDKLYINQPITFPGLSEFGPLVTDEHWE